jgi:penicillin-binding protein 1A
MAHGLLRAASRHPWMVVAILFLVLGGVTVLYGLSVTLHDLPQPGRELVLAKSIVFMSRDGKELAERNPARQTHVVLPLARMGKYGPAATLAAEDRDFYHHGPVNPPALLRAALSDIVSGGAAEGGSTITQQLVKIQLLTPQKTISRKLKELALAAAVERKYSKDQILEMYLNRVYFGEGAYGFGAAVKTYFGADKPPADLTPGQAAFLAGLIQAPSGDDPRTHWDRARARQ